MVKILKPRIWKKLYKKLQAIPAFLFILPAFAFLLFLESNSSFNAHAISVINNSSNESSIRCQNPQITDGDTFRCNGYRIRLAGIDTPEMPGHCRTGRNCTSGDPYAARDFLHSISRGLVTCQSVDTDHYGRTVARCRTDHEDLSCAMLKANYAVRRYGHISC